jgi:hypothetical protein
MIWQLLIQGNLNTSVQVGDHVFTSGGATSSAEGFNTTDYVNATSNEYQSDITYIGTVNLIVEATGSYNLFINPASGATPPASSAYIFFSKKQDVNVSSLKGYYNAVKFKNNSKRKAELFSVACSITASSK